MFAPEVCTVMYVYKVGGYYANHGRLQTVSFHCLASILGTTLHCPVQPYKLSADKTWGLTLAVTHTFLTSNRTVRTQAVRHF